MKNTWSEKGKVKMALITRRPQIPAYPDQMNNHHPCITNKLKLNTLGQKKVKIALIIITRKNQIPAYQDRMNNQYPCITKESENEKHLV